MQRVHQMTEELNMIASAFNNKESIQSELNRPIEDTNIVVPKTRPAQIRPSLTQKITDKEKYMLRMRALAQDSVHETKTYRVFLKHQKREANRLEKLKVHKLGTSPNMRPPEMSLVKLGKLRTSIDSCDSTV